MAPTPASIVAMLHVRDVETSIAFYAKLGFRVGNTFTPEGATAPTWAWLESGGASLMVSLADEPVVPEQQAVLFYLYYEDVNAAHRVATEAGLEPGAMSYPFYCPAGEFRLRDPDGYCLMVTHV